MFCASICMASFLFCAGQSGWWLQLAAVIFFGAYATLLSVCMNQMQDILVAAKDQHFAILARHMRNPTDSLFMYPSILILSQSLPFLLLVMDDTYATVGSFAAMLYSADRLYCVVEDLMHNDIHNPVFRTNSQSHIGTWLALRLIEAVLTFWSLLLHGRCPYRYSVQHLCIHHTENNCINDPESTTAYDRGSVMDFSRFCVWNVWYTLTHFPLVFYLWSRRKRRGLRTWCCGVIAFTALCYAVGMKLTLHLLGAQVWWGYAATWDIWW